MVKRTRAALVGSLAILALAGCTSSSVDEPTPAPSASTVVSVAAIEDAGVSEAASPTPARGTASPSPEPASPTLFDANGTWCPTSPDEVGESCMTVALPAVTFDGFADLPSYVWPDGVGDQDPRTFTAADYSGAPTMGQCWGAVIDAYPAMSGAAFWYCPAGAVAGVEGVDDPWSIPGVEDIPDVRDQDRIYITQDSVAYPYVRAQS